MMTFPFKQKYNACKVELDGFRFDSKGEAKRYEALKEKGRLQQISNLVIHPRFVIHEKLGCLSSVTFTPDFSYTEFVHGCKVIEDVKGMITDAYNLKRNMYLRYLLGKLDGEVMYYRETTPGGKTIREVRLFHDLYQSSIEETVSKARKKVSPRQKQKPVCETNDGGDKRGVGDLV